MTARHTFHTPSFGDEEFQLPESQVADPPYDGQTRVGQWQSFSVHGTHNTGGGMYGDAGATSGDDSDENGTKNVKYSAQDAVSANMGEKKKKRDPNEPKKPVSAYALFFRDTQAAIKVQNPNASFGEVSKVVASMWDALDPEHKNVYKKKTEAAKKEYLKSLAAYRANALTRAEGMNNHNSPPHNEVASPTKAATVKAPPAVVKITRVENSENLLASSANESQNDFQNSSQNSQPPKQPAIEQQHLNMASAPEGHQAPENADQTISTQKCIRDGCSNIAIVNPDWEDEYCSNECVIVHCRNVFTNWVQANVQTEAYPAS